MKQTPSSENYPTDAISTAEHNAFQKVLRDRIILQRAFRDKQFDNQLAALYNSTAAELGSASPEQILARMIPRLVSSPQDLFPSIYKDVVFDATMTPIDDLLARINPADHPGTKDLKGNTLKKLEARIASEDFRASLRYDRLHEREFSDSSNMSMLEDRLDQWLTEGVQKSVGKSLKAGMYGALALISPMGFVKGIGASAAISLCRLIPSNVRDILARIAPMHGSPLGNANWNVTQWVQDKHPVLTTLAVTAVFYTAYATIASHLQPSEAISSAWYAFESTAKGMQSDLLNKALAFINPNHPAVQANSISIDNAKTEASKSAKLASDGTVALFTTIMSQLHPLTAKRFNFGSSPFNATPNEANAPASDDKVPAGLKLAQYTLSASLLISDLARASKLARPLWQLWNTPTPAPAFVEEISGAHRTVIQNMPRSEIVKKFGLEGAHLLEDTCEKQDAHQLFQDWATKPEKDQQHFIALLSHTCQHASDYLHHSSFASATLSQAVSISKDQPKVALGEPSSMDRSARKYRFPER